MIPLLTRLRAFRAANRARIALIEDAVGAVLLMALIVALCFLDGGLG